MLATLPRKRILKVWRQIYKNIVINLELSELEYLLIDIYGVSQNWYLLTYTGDSLAPNLSLKYIIFVMYH